MRVLFFKLLAVLLMGIGFGILYRIPRSLLVPSGLVGSGAWLIYYLSLLWGLDSLFANFLASLALGTAAETMARLFRKPASLFTLIGFIPLVPGRDAYTSMLLLVKGNYIEGMAMAIQAMLIAGAIAFGILLSSAVYRSVINFGRKGGWIHAGSG